MVKKIAGYDVHLGILKVPSVLILSEVLTTAKSVALNKTVPSELSGMFIDTKRLHATRCGHSLPKPGENATYFFIILWFP